MPIHDQGYRRYAGRRRAHGGVWWVIARAGLRARLRERRFLGLLIFAWLPFFVRAVQLYIAANVPQAQFLAATPQMFREFMDQQGFFVFAVTIYAGAGLIADDRRANALQIYLSKPLTRVDYIAGKLATLAIFLTAVTWVPALLLLVLQLLFSGSTAFLRANLYLFPAVTVFAAIQVFVSAFAILALSSTSRNSRFVAVMYAGVLIFTAALYQALRMMTGSRSWAWISPGDALDVLANAIFRTAAPASTPVPAALLAVLVLVAASIWILERQVRGVEVVA